MNLNQEVLREWGQVADQIGVEYELLVQFGLELHEKRFQTYKANVLDRLKNRQPRGKKGKSNKQQG